MVKFSDAARIKILALLKAESRPGLALRMAIRGRGPGGFQYDLRFVTPDERVDTDRVIDADGFEVHVDDASVPKLEGATVDFVEDVHQSGFKIENPNPVWDDPSAAAVQKVLDTEINPAVAAHGGFVTLLDVRDGVAYIALGGGCQGCGMVDVTLKQGIEVRIREAVPEVRQIIDTTDHAEGRNPYYQPSKGGRSPLV